MSTLTSFDALHEPPPQPEDPPENVLSKIFQRVKSTLSSAPPPPSAPLPTSTSYAASSNATAATTTTSSSYAAGYHIDSQPSGSSSKSVSSHPPSVIVSSVAASDPSLGSWTLASDNSSSIGINTRNSSSSSLSTKSGTPTVLPAPKIDSDDMRSGSNNNATMERSVVPRRQYPGANAPKRASSLFKVSTMDRSLVQDDDTASLASLAPPVVSLSPVFGDQQNLSDAPFNGAVGTMTIRSPDSRLVDHTRLGAGDGSVTRDYIHSAFGAREPSGDSDTRSIRSFSSVHQKGNSLTKLIRRVRGEGVSKEYWMTDENAKECFGCSASFFVFRRKHHCRICGHIFCSKCASKIISGIKLGYEGYLRVCNYCLDIMQQYEEQEHGSGDYSIGTSWSTPSPSIAHSHFSQSIPMSPNFNSPHHDATPLDGIRKFLHSKSNRFLARSRSNTTTGDQIDGTIVPFRRSLALEDGNMHDSVLDPEIAPFMGEEEDDDQDDLWPSSSPNGIGFVSIHDPNKEGNSEDDDDDDDFAMDYGSRDKFVMRTSRAEDIRDMFAKDRSPISRRISVNGNRPNRNLSLSLKTRGLLRSDGSESARSPMDVRPASPFLGPNSQVLLHPGRHSRAASMATSAVELNNASLQHMRRLLRQLLTRFEIDNSDGWDEVIMKIVLKVSNSIQVLDNMDVMEIVKIKKIPGGTAQDTLYINGVVCTKNLAHKQMSRSLQNPRILLLKFALEYQRHENHFISLEPIVNQEKEYLKNLVARIVALRPHIIVVEKTVSRLALELLLKHNVAVAYNVKPEVTEAIAQSTGAQIILSFDKLAKEPQLGTCGSFEVKTFVHELIPNKRKSYMFFQDCPGNLFCSLALRGGSLETLNRIKKVVRLMVWVSYNLKLETSLMSDQFAMTSALQESQLIKEETVEISPDPDISRLQESLVPYKQTILSASPFVKFNPPFLLTQMIGDAMKLKAIEKSTTPTALREIGNAKILFAAASGNAIINKSSTGRSQDSGFVEGAYIDISNDFQAKSKAWEDFLSSNIGPPHIVPFAYQNLAFLFSNVCMPSKTICVGPGVRLIQYYTQDTDVTLANYLDQLCWESNFICPSKTCDRPLRDHQRIYAHADAKITVTVEQWDSPTILKKDSIMMWSKCKVCKVETPHVYISEDTKNYSFGKFLELIFYQSNLTFRANICPHDINRNHIRYFGVDTQLVKVERIPIQLYDINFPPMLVRCKPEYYARTKNQDLDAVRSLITRYWDSVMERIQNCIFDVVQPSKIEAAKQELLEMSRNVVVEKKWILQLLQQTYLNSSPIDTLALNMVRIKLYEKAVMWNKTFNEFAREYFNPERDFRRSTTSQLRRLFDEKEFPVASDRAHHASLMNDLPMTLDSSDSFDFTGEDYNDQVPSDLPYLSSSPTAILKIAKPNVEEGDVAALENAIETAASQIAFPFMEPKVTRRLSMNLMQEFRPRLAHAQTSDSILTVTDENTEKAKPKESLPPPVIPRLPVSSRATTRVSSRLSMVSLPTFDPMTILNPERKDNQQLKPSLLPTPTHSGASSPIGPARHLGEQFIIPLDRTPTTEKPISASSTSSGKNPFFFNKPRARRPTEAGGLQSSSAAAAAAAAASNPSPNSHAVRPLERSYPAGNTLTSTNLSNRRSLYLARAQASAAGGGNNIPTPTNTVAAGAGAAAAAAAAAAAGAAAGAGAAATEPHKYLVGNRTRALTQPMMGSNQNAKARYMHALSGRNSRPLETKQPTIEVFSSVKEAAKEESEDEDDYQSEGEGDEQYQPSRGYTFSLIQTDAMDEALGSEDPSTMEATNNLRGYNNNGRATEGVGSSQANNGEEGSFLDPILMMFLGDDDHSSDQPQNSTTTTNGSSGGANGLVLVGSPPVKASSMNMTVSSTLSAALAAASKLPQLSEVAEGVERGSLIKTLSNFWQDRNSSNFTPLNFPMQPFEHVFPYSQIIVREDEPSSIIALTLSSPQYVDKLKGIFRGDGGDGDNHSNNHSTAPMSTSRSATPAEDSAAATYDGTGDGSPSLAGSPADGIYDDIHVFDDSLLSEPGTHMKFPFLDGSTMLYCKIFYMEQFHALRKAAGCEYSYIQSLARCMRWDATGGKSGSSFLKTRDDRFIMKQLSKVELEAFIKFAPHYFQYMQKAIYHKRPTVLAKIFGFYRVGYKHGALGRSMNMDVLIMENLFYDRKNLQVFDLKGSRRNRYVQPSGKENEVLLDENFIEYMSESPFFIREHAKLQLSESLANDSQFLQRFNIMDYSLLVAIADDQQELLVGIVDFIRPFTWDKKLESWVKDAVGSKEPTIVSPAQYRKRFRSAMNRHLDMVPDRWFDIEPLFADAIVHRSIGRSRHQHHIQEAAKEHEEEWLQQHPQSTGEQHQQEEHELSDDR
ncbi:1-phosphatidylinositol-3-phosphate 5-kinase [Dissophora globulifera]|uniref:1-phosphatidylinositol-3-phosphate 5-kinase n=1 Tax=Dissophora globulifera TaxID=979702 RepID=A0A9P6RCK3_9FUNG|nr:1-phosphatidylinositol-3-phosphate 5-kinase [Dissophora globulifera]